VSAEDWISDGICCAAPLKAVVICCVADANVCWPLLAALVIEFSIGVRYVEMKVLVAELMS